MSPLRSKLTPSSISARVVLLLIFAGGLFLRLFELGHLPNGLSCDEAATGYDAYSLLETGTSLYGEPFPLLMNHHGIDYVEGMYTYLTVASVFLFELSPFSTRLVAAVAGALTILTSYLLTRQLFGRAAAVVAAALVALSPWHFHLSRIGVRRTLLPLFVTFGIYLFLRALDRKRSLVPAALILGLALHTYAVAKVVVPLVIFSLVFFYRAEIRDWLASVRRPRWQAAGAMLALAAPAAPIYVLSLLGSANLRFESLSIFGHPAPLRRFALGYLLQLNPLFLFVEGDLDPREDFGSFGLVLPTLVPFLLYGLVLALRREGRAFRLLAVLFLIGAIPPALTVGAVPHASRGIGAVPYLEIMAAAALVAVARAWTARGRGFKTAKVAVLAIPIMVNAAVVSASYFERYPLISPYHFQYGMEEAVRIAERDKSQYGWIVFSARINQAYVFPLFFAPVHPHEQDWPGHAAGYVFLQKNTKRFWAGRHLIVVLDCEEVQGVESRETHSIRGPDGEPFLRLLVVDLPEPTWVGIGKRRPCYREPPLLADSRVRRFTKSTYDRLWRVFGLKRIAEPTPWD